VRFSQAETCQPLRQGSPKTGLHSYWRFQLEAGRLQPAYCGLLKDVSIIRQEVLYTAGQVGIPLRHCTSPWETPVCLRHGFIMLSLHSECRFRISLRHSTCPCEMPHLHLSVPAKWQVTRREWGNDTVAIVYTHLRTGCKDPEGMQRL
jgi:hypothetical protein